MKLEHAIHGIMNDVIETVAIQKTAASCKFLYLIVKLNLAEISFEGDGFLAEAEISGVGCESESNSPKLKSIRILNRFSLARKGNHC